MAWGRLAPLIPGSESRHVMHIDMNMSALPPAPEARGLYIASAGNFKQTSVGAEGKSSTGISHRDQTAAQRPRLLQARAIVGHYLLWEGFSTAVTH